MPSVVPGSVGQGGAGFAAGGSPALVERGKAGVSGWQTVGELLEWLAAASSGPAICRRAADEEA